MLVAAVLVMRAAAMIARIVVADVVILIVVVAVIVIVAIVIAVIITVVIVVISAAVMAAVVLTGVMAVVVRPVIRAVARESGANGGEPAIEGRGNERQCGKAGESRAGKQQETPGCGKVGLVGHGGVILSFERVWCPPGASLHE
jgi:hypothetical protein